MRPSVSLLATTILTIPLWTMGFVHAWPMRHPRPRSMRGIRIEEQHWDFPDITARGQTYRVMAFDGHTHTAFSRDAVHPIADFMWLAETRDLDMIVITDHGATAARRYLDREYRGPVSVVIGAEIGGSFGHAVVYGLSEGTDMSTESMQAVGDHVHPDGAVVVLAHPGWWIGRNTWNPRRWMQYDALRRGGIGDDIDALELWSQVYWHRSRLLINDWAQLLDQHLYVPIVGNSDFHRALSHQMGIPRNACLCPLNEDGTLRGTPQECLLSAVREGRLYVTDGPTIDLQVAGRIPGEIVPVLPHTLLPVVVRAMAPEGGEVHVYVGSEIHTRLALSPGVALEERFVVPVPEGDSYVRVEIARLSNTEDEPPFSLLTNPIRIDVLPSRDDGWRGPDEGELPGPEGFTRREMLAAHQCEMRQLMSRDGQ